MLASNNDYHGFYGVVTKWVLILEPKFNFKNFQADYTYGTKKSSSFNVSFLKPLRGKLKTNLTGIIYPVVRIFLLMYYSWSFSKSLSIFISGNLYQSTGEYPQSGFKERLSIFFSVSVLLIGSF